MTEISETEIKSMTKEQNYMRGYRDGKSDVLDEIRAEIEEYKSRQLSLAIGIKDLEKGRQIALEYVLAIIDNYEVESEVRNDKIVFEFR